MMSVTTFQERVYRELRRVPAGYVTTYKALAAAVGCRSPRAIGQAMKRNPYAPDVPCHRVIASDLTIGGFNGKKTGPSIQRKLRMLMEEGVQFKNGRLVDEAQCFRF
jgi:methylated-DNA-[protein]-cysteine S-methyltransferase